ncbi:Uncharacterized protein GBIM_15095 [Gryllus bimaculatus]|nr:Uncharacterized protein GBIM_15095 [Gryllus bimaculatus]
MRSSSNNELKYTVRNLRSTYQRMRCAAVGSAAPPDGPVFYFPLANASLVVPVLLPPGTALLRTRALPLPALSAGGRPNYRLRRGAPPWLQAGPVAGRAAPRFRVLGDEETRSLCAANNSTATLCFWQSMDMQLLEESPGVDLGPPGPTYLQNFCRQTFRYRLDDESSSDALAVRPLEAPDGEWRLQSTRPLDREADAAAPGGGPTQHARLLCSAAGGGEGRKEAGHAVDVRVHLIDRDDNPPEKQASDLVVYLSTNHLLKVRLHFSNTIICG